MYKIPENARTVSSDSAYKPRVLPNDCVWRHEAASGLARPVVVWDYSVQTAAGHAAGDHDGIRDGYHAGQYRFMRMYCSLIDWLAAGNPDPR